MNDEKLPLCIKLEKEIRRKFKKITHERQVTMQTVLEGFVAYYITNPEAFSVNNNTSIVINQGELSGKHA